MLPSVNRSADVKSRLPQLQKSSHHRRIKTASFTTVSSRVEGEDKDNRQQSAAEVHETSNEGTTAEVGECIPAQEGVFLPILNSVTDAPIVSCSPLCSPSSLVAADVVNRGHTTRTRQDRATSPSRPSPIPHKKGASLGVGTLTESGKQGISLKKIRTSFEAQTMTVKRLLSSKGHGAGEGASFLAVALNFAQGIAMTLDLSDGFLSEVDIDQFRHGIRLISQRPLPFSSVDVSGFCSEAQARLILELLTVQRSVTIVKLKGCAEMLSKTTLREIAEACVVNEEYSIRYDRTMERRERSHAKRVALARLIADSEALFAQEAEGRQEIISDHRKSIVKLSAVEHMQLVSAHRAIKRREQEVEFEAMRQALRDLESVQRLRILIDESERNCQVNTIAFEVLRRRWVTAQESESRVSIVADCNQRKRDIRMLEHRRLQKHREMIAALSMEEFGGRRDLAVLEAQFRACLQGNSRQMKAEAAAFSNERASAEDIDMRKRRVEIDKLDKERHGFREHCRHEDSRQLFERVRERERFFSKVSQSSNSIEREEAAQFRLLREIRALLFQCCKIMSAATEAEVQVAQYCRDKCGPCPVLRGRRNIYSYAVVQSILPCEQFPLPWFPLSALEMEFTASQASNVEATLIGLVDAVRTLRRKALHSIEDTEMKLLTEGTMERCVFCITNELRPPARLDDERCPVVSRFLSQRKIIRSARLVFHLVQRQPSTTFVDSISCAGFELGTEGCATDVMGLTWRRTDESSATMVVLVCEAVTDTSCLEFQEAAHRTFCSAVSTLVNRLCFRRILPPASAAKEGIQSGSSCFVSSGVPNTAEIAIAVSITVDGIAEQSIDAYSQKLLTETPLTKSCVTHTTEEVVRVEVRPPLLSIPSNALAIIRRQHGFSSVMRHVAGQVIPLLTTHKSDAIPSPSSRRRESNMSLSLSMSEMPMKLPTVHPDSTLSVELVGSEIEHLSLMLRVEPSTLVLDDVYPSAGGARLKGKQVTLGRCPMFFALARNGGDHSFRFPSRYEDVARSLEVDLGSEGVTTDDIVCFLQQCIVVSVAQGAPSFDSIRAVVRVGLHDDQDIVSILEVPITGSENKAALRDDGEPPVVLVSPDPMRPLALHPGDDPTTIGLPNTLDEHHAVLLMPRAALLPCASDSSISHYLIDQIDDYRVEGKIVVAQQRTDPSTIDEQNAERFVVFSPLLRPMNARRRSQVALTNGTSPKAEVTLTGPVFELHTREGCTVKDLIEYMRGLYVTSTHFLMRPKSVTFDVTLDVVLTAPTPAEELKDDGAKLPDDALNVNAAVDETVSDLVPEEGKDNDGHSKQDQDNEVDQKKQPVQNSTEEEPDDHEAVIPTPEQEDLPAQEPCITETNSPPPPSVVSPPPSTAPSLFSLRCSVPIEVHEGRLPITAKRKRVAVTENTGWNTFGPFQFQPPDARITFDAYNTGHLKMWIADGRGPEDVLAVRLIPQGSICLRLVRVDRVGGGSSSVMSSPSIAPTPSSSVVASSTTAGSPSGGGDPSAPQQATGAVAANSAGKSILVLTPRRKGPAKVPKLDEVWLESTLDPFSLERMSALSHRRCGKLTMAAMEHDISSVCFPLAASSRPLSDERPRTTGGSKDAAVDGNASTDSTRVPPLPLSVALLTGGELNGQDEGAESDIHHDEEDDEINIRVLQHFPTEWSLQQKAAWLVREHIRRLLNSKRGDEMTQFRRNATQSNFSRVFTIYRRERPLPVPVERGKDGTFCGGSSDSDDGNEGLKLLGTLTQLRSSLEVQFIPPTLECAPVSSDDVLAILDSVGYSCEPCTAFTSQTKLVECSLVAVDGPEDRFSQLITLTKSETYPMLQLLRPRIVLEPNNIEMMCLGTLPVTPYAQCLVQAQSAATPYFDGGKLSYEIVSGGQEGDNLYLMNRDEQLKAKSLFETWRQEQMFLRSRCQRVDAAVEDLLHRFVPFEGIGEVSATGRMMRTNVQIRTKGDDMLNPVGMTEAYNPFKVLIELGPYTPEHISAMHVMLAMSAVGFKTTAGPGDRVVRISLTRGGVGNSVLTTHTRLVIAVRSPQLCIAEGSTRTFACKRILKAPATWVSVLPATVSVNLDKFGRPDQRHNDDDDDGEEVVLRQGYLEMRMIGVETGETLFFSGTAGSDVCSNNSFSSSITPFDGVSGSPPFSVLGRRVFIGSRYIGTMVVATTTAFKLDFDWSSQCTAQDIMSVLRSLSMRVGTGVPLGVSPVRRVEIILCTGTTCTPHSEGCTSILTASITLDAPLQAEAQEVDASA